MANNENKLVITKENLIGIISNKCEDDYISIEDLHELIKEATDEDGIISRKRLFKSVKGYHTKSVVRDIYNLFEEAIFNSLSSVNAEQNVCIRLFEGINLDGIYVPERTMKNNLTGKMSVIESKIKPKFSITRRYCDKINSN